MRWRPEVTRSGWGGCARGLLDGIPHRGRSRWGSSAAAAGSSVSGYGVEDAVVGYVMPTPVTYVAVLSACGKGKELLLGIQVHKRVLESGVSPNLRLENALVDM
ncbi:hypothetical protein GUJ93_ZPchr0001g30579 [Zizania palustris]|uniref:Uncharacterized protein n=1 Tax=Zizania palustris TaxID=103762 RepID=A0A8J5VSY2_ZIZPA|nr:hypothetical protein GUJ93_ZPchr0001g30579 [Zizania palustris]